MTATLMALCIMISTFMMIFCVVISKKSTTTNESLSPFECGFNPQFKTRSPFSLQFFLIALIFLIFDVEITLILPTPLSSINSTGISLSFILLMLILLAGLFHEWNQGSLNWL